MKQGKGAPTAHESHHTSTRGETHRRFQRPPKSVDFIDALPRNPSGKILRPATASARSLW